MHQLNAIAAGLRLSEKSEVPAVGTGRDFRGLTTFGSSHFYADSAIAPPRATRTLGVDNLRHASDEARAAVVEHLRRVVAEHGEDPCTRPQTAAHEAGHVVAAWALLGETREVRVTTHRHAGRTLWLGSNENPRATTPRTDRHSVLCRAVFCLAGLAGEHFAKLSHPASSIDEMYAAHALCGHLDAEQGAATGTHAAVAGMLVNAVLERNEPQFDLIRRSLEVRRRLTAKQVAGMMANGARVEVPR